MPSSEQYRLIGRMDSLFMGRRDAYGAVHGESIKQPLSAAVWYDHLYGNGSVGVYPLVSLDPAEPEFVKWGCIDIDEGYDRGLAIAKNLHTALSCLGITAWIELTKGKGYHVWVFCADWVPAVDMRRALQAACQAVDYTPKEVNPKQTELEPGQLGNYVNVPYARRWVAEGKRVVLGFNDPLLSSSGYPLEGFLNHAEANLNHPTVIAEVAALYKQPPPPKPVVWRPQDRPYQIPWLKGLARKMVDDGPLPNPHTGRVDRSAALMRLAYALKSDGFTAMDALTVLYYFDWRPDMGKYVGRRDADDRYREIVERAYG